MCNHHLASLLKRLLVVHTTRVTSQGSSVFFQAFVHFLVCLKLGIDTNRIIYIPNK